MKTTKTAEIRSKIDTAKRDRNFALMHGYKETNRLSGKERRNWRSIFQAAAFDTEKKYARRHAYSSGSPNGLR